jgi:arylsulfatase A-like enzyme
VPLVIRYPKAIAAGTRVSNGVSTVGTLDTILELADIDPGPLGAHIQVETLLGAQDSVSVGKPLLAERFEEEMLASRFAPGTANGTGEQVNPNGRYRVYRDGPWKLVQHSEDGTFLFNLDEDPGEFTDLAGSRQSIVQKLTEDLDSIRDELRLPELDAEITPPELPELTAEEIQSLCQLGYMEGPQCQ